MDSPYLQDPRRSSVELSRCYYQMGYVFKHHVKNNRAAAVCAPISWLYFIGWHQLGQILHNVALRPCVRPAEWDLLIMYGRKIKII